MKNPIFFLLVCLFAACVSKPEKIIEPEIIIEETVEATSDPVVELKIKRTGFRYDVPDDMEESPKEAKFYRFENLLVDKGTEAFQSSRVIAIRHVKEYKDYSLQDFVTMDQKNFYNDRHAVYEKGWETPGLEEKKIEHLSYEFTYFDRNIKVYQRSVYIKFDNDFYIISLSSLVKSNIIDEKNNFFWRSIRVD
jgi:hypothetical protein